MVDDAFIRLLRESSEIKSKHVDLETLASRMGLTEQEFLSYAIDDFATKVKHGFGRTPDREKYQISVMPEGHGNAQVPFWRLVLDR